MPRTALAFSKPPKRLLAKLAPATMTIKCGTCGLDYHEDEWVNLALERLIESIELEGLLTRWPADTRVEVRRCHGCGRLISAKRRVAGAARRESA